MESLGCQVETKVSQGFFFSLIHLEVTSLSAPAMNNTFYSIGKYKCQCFKQSE